jgi:hypothetical protein
MLSNTLILAVAATGLMAGAAFAQNSSSSSYPDKTATPPDKIQNSPFSPNTVNPTPVPNDITPAPTGAQSNASANVPVTSSAPAATVTSDTLVTNGPVPDTRSNRAKYGAPESHAGKLTRPAGN